MTVHNITDKASFQGIAHRPRFSRASHGPETQKHLDPKEVDGPTLSSTAPDPFSPLGEGAKPFRGYTSDDLINRAVEIRWYWQDFFWYRLSKMPDGQIYVTRKDGSFVHLTSEFEKCRWWSGSIPGLEMPEFLEREAWNRECAA